MSRIGKKPIAVPAGVTVTVADSKVTVEGPKGKLEFPVASFITVTVEDGVITVDRANDERQSRAFHGLTRAMINNMVIGVTAGYEKRLELVGVGYVAAIQNNQLEMRVGMANELKIPIPAGLQVTCPDQTHVLITGIDKQQVTQFAASTRALRPVEPYKGKGIRYQGENVRRKQGKVVAK
ncbi:MAG: 50S ribosomal protein L6 [Planctomycetaceae bacterium]|nr:50S ribosomal protein L6 [Planctomycetaceae bacterium]MBQ2822295.1 50S ribosomal protein L6 [Thermoguttaceae bacterium]